MFNITFDLEPPAEDLSSCLSGPPNQTMEPESKPEANAERSAPSAYENLPLDPEKHEIRLLQARKQVENGQESLLSRMLTVSLLDPEHLPYKALSYVWSDNTPVYDPKVIGNLELSPNNDNEPTTTPIHRLQGNALAAVWQLVDTEEVLTIWIDTICINQEDNDERTAQVAMMASIYQNAEEVVAWLGPDSEIYGVGFEVVDKMAAFGKQYYEERWFQWCYNSDIDADERRSDQYYDGPNGEKVPAWDKVLEAAQASLPEWFVPDQPNGKPPPKVSEFALMGLSTFFSRAWIFQELAFSQKARILSGGVSTTLSNLLMGNKVWHTLFAAGEYSAIFGSDTRSGRGHWNPGEFTETPFNRLMLNSIPLWGMTVALLRVRDIDRPAIPAPTLTQRLLISFTGFNATDPRDKIFALWGFVSDGPHRELLHPDYSLSIEEVFSKAARYMALTNRELAILTTHGHGKTSYELFVHSMFGRSRIKTELLDLPSWVPDWRMSLSNNATSGAHNWLIETHKGKQPLFNDEEFGRLVQFSDDSLRLNIKGMKIGTISAVYGGDMFPYPPQTDDRNEDDSTALTLKDGFANFMRLADNGQEILCQYFRFVFRSAEGTTNKLFNYETDLSEPIHTMRFLQNGNISVDEEGVFGARLIKFLVRLIGENDLFELRAVGEDIEDRASVETFFASNAHGEVILSKWWDAITGSFDIQTWPESMKYELKATACGAGKSEEGRAESMEEIRAWIGTKTFNFFIVPGFGLGVCPKCVKPEVGDFVFRPAAHDGPIVLRPVGDGTYKNVGECFVSHVLVRAMDDEKTMRSMMPLFKTVGIV